MKIALIHNVQSTGSALYRLELPHAHLDAAYKGLTFYSAPEPFRISDESFEQMDIVLVSRMWGETAEQIKWLRDKCTKFNVTLILDLDDYWVLESGHPMVNVYREKNISNIIREHIRVVDHVICTNAYLTGMDTLDIMAISGHSTEKAKARILNTEPYNFYPEYIEFLINE